MSQRGTVNDSRRLADTIVPTFGQNGVRLLPRTHRQAGFAVLTSPDIPAALVELGYLSNPQDEKLLTVRQHQLAPGAGAPRLDRRPFCGRGCHKKGVTSGHPRRCCPECVPRRR